MKTRPKTLCQEAIAKGMGYKLEPGCNFMNEVRLMALLDVLRIPLMTWKSSDEPPTHLPTPLSTLPSYRSTSVAENQNTEAATTDSPFLI